MKLAFAWIAGNLIPLAIVGIVGFLVLTNVRGCKDGDQSKDAAVMAERLRADSVTHVSDSVALLHASAQLDTALARGTQIVERWHESAPRPIPVGTPHDSIAHLITQVRSCRAVGDSLAESVVKIRSGCAAFRDTATRTIRDQRTAYAHLDSLYKIGKPPKRWSFGPALMYGFRQDSAWKLTRGFSAGLAITYAVFSW